MKCSECDSKKLYKTEVDFEIVYKCEDCGEIHDEDGDKLYRCFRCLDLTTYGSTCPRCLREECY